MCQPPAPRGTKRSDRLDREEREQTRREYRTYGSFEELGAHGDIISRSCRAPRRQATSLTMLLTLRSCKFLILPAWLSPVLLANWLVSAIDPPWSPRYGLRIQAARPACGSGQ